jgi:tRNA(fMet)-specific endonuclease VapC
VSGRQQVDAFVVPYDCLPFDDSCVKLYARLRADLETHGLLISENDYLIAAIALAHKLILITHNTSEFSRVQGLTLEDWEIP